MNKSGTNKNYSGYLKNDYSPELVEMFKPLLRKYAEKNTGRPAYQEPARWWFTGTRCNS